nr:MAG TPA: hypothetical protein [Caudoviricetes sp.]
MIYHFLSRQYENFKKDEVIMDSSADGYFV